MIGVLTSTVAPGRLGEPSRAFVIARHVGEPRRYLAVVLGTVFSQTLLNLAALVVLAAVTFAHAAFFRGHEVALISTLALPALVAAGVIGGPRLLQRAGRARWEPVRRLAGWLARELLQARQGLRVFKRGAEGARAAASQLAAWALQWLACYATILALGLHPDQRLGAAAAVLLAVNVSAVLPPAPGNVGIFQGACIVVLAAYGVAAADALAYGILLQAVEIVTALALGVPALLAEGLSWRELRAGARSTLGS
jgi:phosphatidylinositol alpha-mannosyltransferase